MQPQAQPPAILSTVSLAPYGLIAVPGRGQPHVRVRWQDEAAFTRQFGQLFGSSASQHQQAIANLDIQLLARAQDVIQTNVQLDEVVQDLLGLCLDARRLAAHYPDILARVRNAVVAFHAALSTPRPPQFLRLS